MKSSIKKDQQTLGTAALAAQQTNVPAFLVSPLEKGAELVGWVVFTARGVSDPGSGYPKSNLLEWVVSSSPPWHS